ncbi:hypothetical protein CCACVL1_19925 [Corchorus capsularis]|uniref:Uncharacterized protein n=1 Tax=Corchorus capsularis TaxID=210143 RepID=A0A1R3HDW5_COCAP|nr:hypothetical protein CCACVL1_19925 [Corchorus capsularis]
MMQICCYTCGMRRAGKDADLLLHVWDEKSWQR